MHFCRIRLAFRCKTAEGERTGAGRIRVLIAYCNKSVMKPDSARLLLLLSCLLGFSNQRCWAGDFGRYSQKSLFIDTPQGKVEALTKALEAWTPEDGNSDKAIAFANRAAAYALLGDYGRSIQDSDEAIRLKPDFSDAWSNRGSAWQDAGDLDKALADLDKAVELDPRRSATRYNRGSVHLKRADFRRAVADFDEAIKLQKDYGHAYVLRGSALVELGEYERALRDMEEGRRLLPSNAESHFNVASLLSRLGDFRAALPAFDQAVSLSTGDADAHLGRALAYLALNDLEKALPDLSRTLALRPSDVTALSARGSLYGRKRDYFGAVEDLKRAVALSSGNAALQGDLALTELQLGELEPAIKRFRATLALEPTGWRYWHLILAFRASGDLKAMKSTIEEGAKFVKRSTTVGGLESKAFLSSIYSESEDHAEEGADLAREVLDRVADPITRAVLGRALIVAGQSAEGIMHLERAITAAPGYDWSYYWLGQAYRDRHDRAKAHETFQRGLKVSPQFKLLELELGRLGPAPRLQ